MREEMARAAPERASTRDGIFYAVAYAHRWSEPMTEHSPYWVRGWAGQYLLGIIRSRTARGVRLPRRGK